MSMWSCARGLVTARTPVSQGDPPGLVLSFLESSSVSMREDLIQPSWEVLDSGFPKGASSPRPDVTNDILYGVSQQRW